MEMNMESNGHGHDVESEDDRSYMTQPVDSWERFMILWGVTPEILVGSCILSLMSIVATYLMTICSRNGISGNRTKPASSLLDVNDHDDNNSSTDRWSHRRHNHKDNCDRQSTNSVVANEELSKRPKVELATSTPAEQVPSKRNLYKFASDRLQKTMTDEQLTEENDTKRKQLEAIYNLMRDERELFGIENIRQIEEQMKLYG